MPVGATLIEDLDALDHVGAAWDELTDAMGRPSSSAAWLTAWARHVGEGALRVAVVRDGADVIGVFPGIVVRRAGGVRRLELLGAGTATGIEPLARPGREAEVAGLAARAIAARGPRIDRIGLAGLPAGSPWPALLAARWPGARPGLLRHQMDQPEPLMRPGEGGFDAWLAGKSANFRSQVRRARRALERDGGRVRRTADEGELARDLPAFVRLHHARWEPRGGSDVIDTPVEAMLAEACPRLLAEDRLDLWCVELGGEVVGAQLWLRSAGASTMWLTGSDDRHAALRPAMLIMAAVVEDAHERGLATVSFGGGGQDYKRRFSEAEGTIAWWALPLPGLRLPLVLGEVEAGRARRSIARRLSQRRKAQVRALAQRARMNRDRPES